MVNIISFIVILLVAYGLYSLKQEIATLKNRIDELELKLKENAKIEKENSCISGSLMSNKEKCSDNKFQKKEEKPSGKMGDARESNVLDEPKNKEESSDVNSLQSNVDEGNVSGEKMVGVNATFLYARQFDKGVLKVCSEPDAYYKLQIVSNDEARFEFCGNLSMAKNNFNAVFDDVSDYSGSSSTATKCNTIEKGEAKRINDNKWKVVKKAKIEFK